MSPNDKGRRFASEAARPGVRGVSSSVLIALLLLGTSAGIRDAFGQDGAPQVPSAEGEPGALTPPSGAGSQGTLTTEEMLSKAKELVAGIEQAGQSITRQLQAARKDRDVVRVLCLNDKLNQVDVGLRSAQDRLNAIRSAAERSDEDRTRHEYTVLEVLNDRMRVLVNEANQCVGEETGFIGEAEVSVSVDPNLPNAETTFDSNSSSPPPPPDISSPIQ